MLTPYTDYVLTIELEGADLSTAREIHVTIEQGKKKIDTTDVDVVSDGEGNCTMTAAYTQGQTASLENGSDALVQINWLTQTGERPTPPEPRKINVGRQLLRREIRHD